MINTSSLWCICIISTFQQKLFKTGLAFIHSLKNSFFIIQKKVVGTTSSNLIIAHIINWAHNCTVTGARIKYVLYIIINVPNNLKNFYFYFL